MKIIIKIIGTFVIISALVCLISFTTLCLYNENVDFTKTMDNIKLDKVSLITTYTIGYSIISFIIFILLFLIVDSIFDKDKIIEEYD